MNGKSGKYQAVVIGVSAGGLSALDAILPCFAPDCSASLLVVQHMAPDSSNYLVEHFRRKCRIRVKEAGDKEKIAGGTVYFAPPNYHLLVERDKSLALSAEEKVLYSRPSVDVLFQTAAEAYCEKLVGVVLTGANADGSSGLAMIAKLGGLTIVQAPETANAAVMPEAAIAATQVDRILPLEGIGPFLVSLNYVEVT